MDKTKWWSNGGQIHSLTKREVDQVRAVIFAPGPGEIAACGGDRGDDQRDNEDGCEDAIRAVRQGLMKQEQPCQATRPPTPTRRTTPATLIHAAQSGLPAGRHLDGFGCTSLGQAGRDPAVRGFTLLTGYVALFLAFLWMLVFWSEGSPYWQVGLAYAFIGIGVGFAGTPASHSLTGSVPVRRAGMASGTADLQRDLGGAIMQSIFGALLTAGYVSAASAQIAGEPNSAQVTSSVQAQLTKSFASAADIAERYPQYSAQIIAGAKSSFLAGADWAHTAGIIAIVVGAVIVFFLFPKREQELQLLAAYQAEDTIRSEATSQPAPGVKD